MALQITETHGMFQVLGSLRAETSRTLHSHILRYMHERTQIILNLEKIKDMDASAAYMLQRLYRYAMRNNCILIIIGQENKRILPAMHKTRTSYILSHDRI